MITGADVSRARRFAASGALLAVAGGVTAVAVRFMGFPFIAWPVLGFAGVAGVGAVALGSRSIVAQVLGRAVAWTVFAPALVMTGYAAAHGRWHGDVLGFLAASGAALLLARPMLHTDDARLAFAPSRFRRWFLASSTASAATGLVMGAAATSTENSTTTVAMSVALAASLVAAAVGVLKMRAWGVLLGLVTSVATLAAAAWMGGTAGATLALAAAPGAMLGLPLAFARLVPERARVEGRVRVAAEAARAVPLRVAPNDDALMEATDRDASAPMRAGV
jgi:hypothetical protein